jgi:hypothetical protein
MALTEVEGTDIRWARDLTKSLANTFEGCGVLSVGLQWICAMIGKLEVFQGCCVAELAYH